MKFPNFHSTFKEAEQFFKEHPIYRCPSCGELAASPVKNETFTCSKCGFRRATERGEE